MKYKLAKPLSIHELGQRKNQEDSIFPKLGAATENSTMPCRRLMIAWMKKTMRRTVKKWALR